MAVNIQDTIHALKAAAMIMEERERVLQGFFQEQSNVHSDPNRRIAVKTSRRAGKSTCLLSIAINQALWKKGTAYPYIALTQDSTRNIVWPILEEIKKTYDIPMELKEHNLTARFENGSFIRLHGADRKDLQDRILGGGVNVGDVFIDECAAWSSSLLRFIEGVIWPILLDRGGSLYLCGAPTENIYFNENEYTYYYQITRDDDVSLRLPGWSVHEWGTPDNPHVKKQYEEMVEQFKVDYGEDVVQQPWFIRQWLGKWCLDSENNVYTFSMDKNTADEWGDFATDEYVLGMDTGWTDGMGFLVTSYNESEYPNFVIRESHWEPKMMTDDIAKKITDYMEQYPGLYIVGDTNNAQLLQELEKRYNIPITPAEKTDKKGWVRIVNNSFNNATIKVVDPHGVNLPITQELIKLKRKLLPNGTWEEDRRTPNHLCDALLYAFRYSYPYLYKAPEIAPKYGTREYMDWKARDIKRKRLEQIKRR